MKSVLVLLLALSIAVPTLAQEPAAPAPAAAEETPAAENTADGKELVDPNHKPESAFEGHDKSAKKEAKKNKKKLKKGKKHGSKKHKKNKKSQA